MPLIPREPPQRAHATEILMPFGYGEVVSEFAGHLDVRLTLICGEFPPTVPEVRALLLRHAGDAVAALEAGGYEIHETVITLSKPPVGCDVRLEVSERRPQRRSASARVNDAGAASPE